MCVLSFRSPYLIVVEKSHLGGFAFFAMWGFSSIFPRSFSKFKFLNQHVLNRLSMAAEDWHHQTCEGRNTGRAKPHGNKNGSFKTLMNRNLRNVAETSGSCKAYSGKSEWKTLRKNTFKTLWMLWPLTPPSSNYQSNYYWDVHFSSKHIMPLRGVINKLIKT